MAWVQVNGIYAPTRNMPTGTTSYLIDASGEKVACIMKVPRTGTLKSVKFRTGTVTTSQTLKVSFQDVSAGFPDGTVDQYRTVTSPASNTTYETGIISSDGTDGGAKRSVTRGDWLAVVIEFDSTVGDLNIAGAVLDVVTQFAYIAHYTTSWALQLGATTAPNIILRYDNEAIEGIKGVFPLTNVTTLGMSTGTTPDEAGILFAPPFAMKTDGAHGFCDWDAAANIILYDSNDNVLASVSVTSTERGTTSVNPWVIDFGVEITLAVGATYRLTAKPTTGSNISLGYTDVSAAEDWDAWPGDGMAIGWTQRSDAGAWSQTTTRRARLGLHISALDDGAGAGGGLLVHPGMAGGMRG